MKAASPCGALLDPFQRKLLAAFEEKVPISGITGIFFRNPRAPSLLLSRSPDANQDVPILLAGIQHGGENANADLGMTISSAGNGRLPLFQCMSEGESVTGIFSPFLFYRGFNSSDFERVATEVCQSLHGDGALTAWLIVKCSVTYITKDGRTHDSRDYPEAFVGD